MFYVNDLGAEKSYGPFATREQATTWATLRGRPYKVTSDPVFRVLKVESLPSERDDKCASEK